MTGGGGVTGCRCFYSTQLTTAGLLLIRTLETNKEANRTAQGRLTKQRSRAVTDGSMLCLCPNHRFRSPMSRLRPFPPRPLGRCLCPVPATVPSLHLAADGTRICQLHMP